MRRLAAHLLLLLAASIAPGVGAPAAAAAPPKSPSPQVVGEYDTPLGRVRVTGDGTRFTGTLAAPKGPCRFLAGSEVLRGTLLDDSLAGQVRLCQTGCPDPEAWASTVLLVGARGLSGAAHVKPPCAAPLGKKGGLSFVRAPPPGRKPAPPRVPPAEARARAREIMRDGAAWLSEGNFEQARSRFLDAIEVDGSIPEAYNGVGVTYRMRNELARALDWYKKALAVDPDFGDAYYNMACVYALQGSKEMALRYLQIAAMNGYATAGGMDEDPDLESLRAEPGYRALVGTRM